MRCVCAWLKFLCLLSLFIAIAAHSPDRNGNSTGQFFLPIVLFVTLGFQLFNTEPLAPWYISLFILLAGYGAADRFRAFEL